MSPNTRFSPEYRSCARQRSPENGWYFAHLRSGKYLFLLGCLVVLLTACSAGSTPLPSHSTTTRSSTSSRPTSPPTATVAPGTVLYQADWSHGLDGWKGSSGWSVVQGDLLWTISSDTSSITAPYRPDVSNYAVEVRLQVVRLFQEHGGFYSIFASQEPGKDGYQAGVSDLMGPGPRPNGSNAQLQIYLEPMSDMPPGTFHPSDNDPKTLWHSYRVDVQDNSATLSVDGNATHSASSMQTDTLSNGPLGLSCGMAVVRFSNYRILAL